MIPRACLLSCALCALAFAACAASPAPKKDVDLFHPTATASATPSSAANASDAAAPDVLATATWSGPYPAVLVAFDDAAIIAREQELEKRNPGLTFLLDRRFRTLCSRRTT